jgi:hypothetical protein
MMLAMGLALSVFVGALAIGSAQEEEVPDAGAGAYFPWVPNGSTLDGMGPFYGAVTVQNVQTGEALDPVDLYFFAGVGENDQAWSDPVVVANVQRAASVTLNASDLNVPEPGSSVRVIGINANSGVSWDSDNNEFTGLPVDDAETTDEENPVFQDLDDVSVPIVGTVKNVSPLPSESGKTSSAHTTVSGYSGFTQEQVVPTDSETHILPIVQSNSGWNTVIRIASFAGERDPNATVSYTVTLYESGGQGAAGQSAGVFTGSIAGGEVEHIDITADENIGEGFVGNAYITANAPIGAVAERYKVQDDMLLTNTSRQLDSMTDEQVAPLIFQNYNNWNSGISVANLDEEDPATVNIAYVTPGGSQVGADQITIPARGMEFVYTPASQDLNVDGFVGAAVITSANGQNIQVAVDQVKYDGVGGDVGDAMSYVTEGQNAVEGEALALPLVQKGNPATGLGDTTGVQLFNADAQNSIEFSVFFLDSTGNFVAPTLNPAAPITVSLSGHQGYTLYTHNYSEMPAGFQGSLAVDFIQGDGELAAVSNNVNYAVNGDGATVFNLIMIGSQTR